MKEDCKNIELFLKQNGYTPIRTRKLLGDASSRRYYISECEGVSLCVSYDVNEFIQNKDFLKTSQLFNKFIRVPEIFVSSNPEIIIQEDLGSVSLNSLMTQKPEERSRFVKQAIADIVKYQSISLSEFQSVSNYEFDDKKIEFEFDLASNYFVEQYLGAAISQEVLEEAKNNLMMFYRENKTTVCHRDYHSRNLMIKGDELVHIDFQDARVGPNTYDIVSLLEDCYFQYTDDEKDELKKYFLKISQVQEETFEKKYNFTAIQRIFKALGSFAYLKIEKNKNQYEKNIGLAFENLRKILEKTPEFEDFRKELCRVYYAN